MRDYIMVIMPCEVKFAILAFAAFICLSACGGLEDKSINEPLSFEQRQGLASKDLNYMMVFNLIDKVEKNDIQLTSSEKKSYEELSYRRLKDFLTKWTDSGFLAEKHEKYEQEWMDILNSYIPKVDSISDYWLDFIEAFKPENYLKVELIEITDKSDVFLGYLKVNIRLTPLRGAVSDVKVSYGLDGSMMDRNMLSYDSSFSSPIVESAWMKYNYAFDIDASKVNDLPLDELLVEYPFESRIVSINIDSKPIKYIEGLSQVPNCVRILWTKDPGKGNEWKNDLERMDCYQKVIKELIDTLMVSKTTYEEENIRREAYEDDDLAATYYYVTARVY